MDTRDFDYTLPEELIARYPAPERTASRLMVLSADSAEPRHESFANLQQFFRSGDVLVLNDTRVLPARLAARKATGGKVEILLERITEAQRCLAHLKSSKSPRAGTELILEGGAAARVLGRQGELFELEFDQDVADYFRCHGHMPLPPYIKRDDELADRQRYQTVYARSEGAVAAPTAGLHFDQSLLQRLEAAGVEIVYLTLHVGAGTFQNLRPENFADGRLHEERVQLSSEAADSINRARADGRRIFAVGTTTTRALESIAKDGQLAPYSGTTDLFIRPGFRFQIVDALITNFHLPGSSLLMLLAAFIGVSSMQDSYRVAIQDRYRFFSYGDAMLVFKRQGGS